MKKNPREYAKELLGSTGVTFDSIEDNDSIPDIQKDAIISALNTAQQYGTQITQDTFADAIASSNLMMNKIASEGITFNYNPESDIQQDTVAGVVANLLFINVFSAVASKVPFVGHLGQMHGVDTKGEKFVSYDALLMASNNRDKIVTKDDIFEKLSTSQFGALARYKTVMGGVGADVVFDLKVAEADTENFKMELRGNRVTVMGTPVNDYGVGQNEKEFTAVKTLEDGSKITVVFDYENGQIKAKFESTDTELDEVQFSFVGLLNQEDFCKIEGQVKMETNPTEYMAVPFAYSVTTNPFKNAQVLNGIGVNLRSSAIGMLATAYEEEKTQTALRTIRELAIPMESPIDVSSTEGVSIADKYKTALIEIEKASADIGTKSQLTNKVCIVGGSFVVELVSALNTDNSCCDKSKAKNAGFGSNVSLIGTIGKNNIEVYYDKSHDDVYSPDAENEAILVVGVPNAEHQRAVIVGGGMPLSPRGGFASCSGEKFTLVGSTVISPNFSPRSSKLVRLIGVSPRD